MASSRYKLAERLQVEGDWRVALVEKILPSQKLPFKRKFHTGTRKILGFRGIPKKNRSGLKQCSLGRQLKRGSTQRSLFPKVGSDFFSSDKQLIGGVTLRNLFLRNQPEYPLFHDHKTKDCKIENMQAHS